MTTIHSESLSLGMEILCQECGSILAVDKVDPLVLTELDLCDD
jgi:hypothetical protein